MYHGILSSYNYAHKLLSLKYMNSLLRFIVFYKFISWVYFAKSD